MSSQATCSQRPPLLDFPRKGVEMLTLPPAGLPQDVHSALDALTPTNSHLVLQFAQRLLALQELQGIRPLHNPPQDLRPFVPDFEAWLAVRGKSSSTRRNHALYTRQILTRHPHPGPTHIDAFLAAKLSAGVSVGTIRNIIFALRSFFDYLQYRGLIAFSPAQHLQLPSLPHRERSVPPATDLSRLLRAPTTTLRDRVILHLFIDCGLRLAELRNSRPADIDLANAQVTVIGKGNKQRTVPFSPDTHFLLQEYIGSLAPGSRWLLPGRPPTKPLAYRSIEQRLDTLCHAAGTPRITPHQFRHFFATSMLNDGANLKVVSALLGHAHASTTTDIYWHVVDAGQRRSEHQRHNPLSAVLQQS